MNWRVLGNHSLYPTHVNIINIEFQVLKLNQNIARMHEYVNFLWKCEFILDVALLCPQEFHLKSVRTLGVFLALSVPPNTIFFLKKCYNCLFGSTIGQQPKFPSNHLVFPTQLLFRDNTTRLPPHPRIRRRRERSVKECISTSRISRLLHKKYSGRIDHKRQRTT